ncbi:MAG: gliding motility-associated C-terminal domain-containing protein [Elusimicrobia bacterium]|nr:gliding motility-associated C-terminal domain-containing protein [Elusimicrobiota bacterium]
MVRKLTIPLSTVIILFLVCSALTAAPAGISDLTALSAGEGEVQVEWTAPGQDQMTGTVSGYLVKYATSQIDSADFYKIWVSTYDQNWAGLQPAGNGESRTITGLVLPAGTTVYVAIKGKDASEDYGVWYSSREYASVNNLNSCEVSVTPPGSITNLSALKGYRKVTLVWTAPGDDGWVGNIYGGRYEVRASSEGPFVDEADWAAAGSGFPYRITWATDAVKSDIHSKTVTGLANGVTYYFAIKIRDEITDNWSVLNDTSPVPQAAPKDHPPGAFLLETPGFGDVVASTTPAFEWADAADPDIGDMVTYTIWYSTRQDYDASALISQSGIDVSSYSPSAGLIENATYWWKVRAVDDDGKEAWTSNTTWYIRVNGRNEKPYVFSLSTPADANILTDNTPMFLWDATADPDPGDYIAYYTVVYSSSQDFGVPVSSTVYISSFTPVSALVENATYWWSVRAYDNDGYKRVSSTRTFRMNAEDEYPYTFNLSTPADTQIMKTKRPSFDWADCTDPDPGDIITYTLRYSQSPDFGTYTDIDDIPVSTYTFTEDLSENATYYWKVFARDSDSLVRQSNQTDWSVRINAVNQSPGSFSVLTPTNTSTVEVRKPTFTVTASSDPDPGDVITYRIYYSTYSDFTSSTTIESGPGETFANTSAELADNSTYFWKARAVDSKGLGTESTETDWEFYTFFNDPPYGFSLSSPAYSEIVSTNTPKFLWQANGDPDKGDSVTYSLWYSTRQDFDLSARVTESALEVSSFTPAAALVEDATYWWSVRAIDNEGLVTLSSTWTFRVNAENAAPGNFDLLHSSGIVTENTPYFEWAAAADPDPGDSITYTLFYSSYSGFTSSVTIGGIDASTYTLQTVLEENTTYWWQVKSADYGGLESWSNQVWSIHVDTANQRPSVFSLVSPTDTVTVVVTTPTFTWTVSTDADVNDTVTYDLEYADDSGFLTGHNTIPGISTDNYHLAGGLADDGTYYWKVTAKDGSGGQRVSAVWSFNIDYNDFPGVFDLVSPGNNADNVGLTPEFNWGDSVDPDIGDVITYTIWCSTRQDFDASALITKSVDVSSCTLDSGLLDNSTYWWKVVAVDQESRSRWSTSQYKFWTNPVNDGPGAFSLSQPADNSTITVLTPGLVWAQSVDEDPGDSVNYTLFYSTYSGFTSSDAVNTLDISSYTFGAGLEDNTTYYWRVKAFDENGAYRWSSQSWKFWINVENDTPSVFGLSSPPDKKIVKDRRPVFRWDVSADADPNDRVRYSIWYSTKSDFSTKKSVSGIRSAEYTPSSNLTENATYYWKVRAYDTNGADIWSSHTDWKFFTKLLDTPAAVTGVRGSLSSSREKFSVSWNKVKKNTNGSDIEDLAGYRVYRSNSMEGLEDAAPAATLSKKKLSWTDYSVDRRVYYYTVRAYDTSGIESDDSSVLDSSREQNLIIVSEDEDALAVIPGDVNSVLYKENNSYGEDLEVVLERETDREGGKVIRSWDIKVVRSSNGRQIKDFEFDKPQMDIQLSYDDSRAGLVRSFGKAAYGVADNTADTQVGVFWYNGIEYVKLGGQIDGDIKAVSIKTSRPGAFRVQQVQRATEFELSWAGTIGPTKVFTPNEDGINDKVNFMFENPKESLFSGEIYDIAGAIVADMTVSDDFDYALMWDGKDRDGNTADKGVYVYQIKSEGKTINGTVILAK